MIQSNYTNPLGDPSVVTTGYSQEIPLNHPGKTCWWLNEQYKWVVSGPTGDTIPIGYPSYVIRDSDCVDVNPQAKAPEKPDKDKRKAFKKFINPEPWKRK